MRDRGKEGNTLQHTLQHTATRCNTLQHAATCCNRSRRRKHARRRETGKQGDTLQQFLQHTPTHCNWTEGRRDGARHTATHTATHCNALQQNGGKKGLRETGSNEVKMEGGEEEREKGRSSE